MIYKTKNNKTFSFLQAIAFKVFFLFSACVLAQEGNVPAAFAESFENKQPMNETVGAIKASTGLVTLVSASGQNKFASDGTQLFVGDVLTTQKGSTAVLMFVDKTQVALRPNTRFVVENYTFEEDEPVADRAEFRLLKGGVRALTGLIGKRSNNDAFALKSKTATIGIRGTDFSARLCQQNECDNTVSSEAQSATANNTSTAGAAGRVHQVSGKLQATGADGIVRDLSRRSPVFSGDVLSASADGFAVLVMADSTRLTLPGGSQLSLETYRYAPDSPEQSVASFQLLKGAVRFITGIIGRAEPDNVKFATKDGTIGIRGTSGDISCVPVGDGSALLVSCSGGDSRVNVDMRDGSVILTTELGSVTINAGQSGFFGLNTKTPSLSPVPLNTLSQIQNAGPIPDTINVEFESLTMNEGVPISKSKQESNEGDLFIAVNDGEIVVTNENAEPLRISRGQGGYVLTVPGREPILWQAPPKVLATDKTLAQPAFIIDAKQCSPG